MKKITKTCPFCGGSGQISFFKGVSRFLLTTEECPECCGTGYLQEKAGEVEKKDCNNPRVRKKRKK